jgi:hypothetical protein
VPSQVVLLNFPSAYFFPIAWQKWASNWKSELTVFLIWKQTCSIVNCAGAVCDQKSSKFFVSYWEESMAGHVGINGVYYSDLGHWARSCSLPRVQITHFGPSQKDLCPLWRWQDTQLQLLCPAWLGKRMFSATELWHVGGRWIQVSEIMQCEEGEQALDLVLSKVLVKC